MQSILHTMARSFAAHFLHPRGPRSQTLGLLLIYCLLRGALTILHAQQIEPSASDPTQAETAGTISGQVVDPDGNYVLSATVKLMREGSEVQLQTTSDEAGRFAFTPVLPGPFQLSITADGFLDKEVKGVLHSAEALKLAPVPLAIAGGATEVEVRVTNYQLAEEQIKVQETQRVLGVIPNFYVTYNPAALPLRPKQKFELAWKTSVDPVTFAASGLVAAFEQAGDDFSGYGQGTQGYAKRFGASYADGFIGGMIGGAVLPSILKQDPRYFYKGNGSTHQRILYALANAVVCKGDNGRWQPNYSGILGSLAAGGISNLYYPASNRNGFRLTLQNTALGIAGSGIGNLFQEFLIRRLTPHARDQPSGNP